MHLDVPLLTVVVRMHLGIDLMLTVSRQVSLDSLNGVGRKPISVTPSNKMENWDHLERDVDVSFEDLVDFKQDR